MLAYVMKLYTPAPTKVPHLQVPENRLEYAYQWCQAGGRHHPLHFSCFAYWIDQCETDGSDY
jgi:hypothetical protein